MGIRKTRLQSNMTQKEFAEYFNIPYRTIQNWEGGQRTPPEYIVELIKYKAEKERLGMLKLVLMEEGQEQTLTEGTLADLLKYLGENYDDLFSWIESDHNSQLPDELEKVELPRFDDIETIKDLEYELRKVDMDWWTIVVEEI